MQSNNLIKGIVGAALGLILFVAFSMPVLVSAQEEVADTVTYTNELSEYLSLSDGDVTITLSSGGLTINGETHNPASSDAIIFVSDYFILQYNGTNYYGSYLNQTAGVRNITAANISVSDNALSASITYDNNTTQTVSNQGLRFSFYVDPNGDYARFVPSVITPYVADIKDIVAGGTFYTGTNKSYYWFYNGEAGGNQEEYTYSFDATLTKVSGTYDIYKASNCVYSIDGEEFTPYHMVVKKTIDGHATSGTMYELVGLLPLLLVVALVLGVVAYAVRARLS